MSKTFRTWREIEDYVKKQIDDCLDKEVAKLVKEEIMTSISTEVYGAGTPVEYVRRGGNPYGGMGNPVGTGSLADINEMSHTVKNGELFVTDDAKRNPDYKDAGTGYDTNKSLAENIAFGYGDRSEWYNKPRNFIADAVKNMKDSNSVVEILKEALENRGFRVI